VEVPPALSGADVNEADVDEAIVELLERSQARGQGFQLDSKLRKELEDYAMNAAKQYLEEELGYKCEDHSKTCPYDIQCRRDEEVLYVEVKGTQSAGDEIILTAGEVEFAQSHKGQMALFVLHSIRVVKGSNGDTLEGGERRWIRGWEVDCGTLKPVSFKYDLPAEAGS
jgi:hypothetical protein